jgi:hypothetical protein
MMAMLVRAGLPSRIAAMSAIRQSAPRFVNVSEMIVWLRSNQVAALTDLGGWPTPETADLWKRFRDDLLSPPNGKWTTQQWTLAVGAPPAVNLTLPARLRVDPATNQVSVVTADFKTMFGIQQRLSQASGSLSRVDFSADGRQAVINRMGRGSARWNQRDGQ